MNYENNAIKLKFFIVLVLVCEQLLCTNATRTFISKQYHSCILSHLTSDGSRATCREII